jgi:hypothetical protein
MTKDQQDTIREAIHTFVGLRTDEVTPEVVLERIRYELRDANFEAEIDITGNEIRVNGIVFSISYSF